MALRLYLFRHGETDWSLSGRYTGRTDLPLTAHGEDAAAKLGVRIRNIPFTRVLTSPLQRAQQTCKLAGLGQSFEIDTDLTEWDNGDDEGRMPAEILKSQPGWDLFRDGSPHGEMPAQICARADRLIARLRAMDGNVALFSHGHLLRVLAARWIGLSVRQAQHFLLNTASLSVLSYEHNCAGQPAIALWNSTVQEPIEPRPEHRVGDTRPMKQRAIEQWESEGGEIPIEQIQTKAVLTEARQVVLESSCHESNTSLSLAIRANLPISALGRPPSDEPDLGSAARQWSHRRSLAIE